MARRTSGVTMAVGLLAVLASLWAASPASAEVRASVEPRIIDELDTARLVIRAEGTNQATALDLSALEQDFEVLTTQSSSQYRSVNGQVESWVDYQVMLRPRRAGDLEIPSIRVGAEATPVLNLRVRGIDADLRDAIARMVFFETELTANPVYVQAQTVMVRRLFYSSGAQIYSDLPGMPELGDAVVVPLGETTSSTTVRDGQRYGVIEQRFAIFPERSGALEIPAISVTSSVRLQTEGRTRRSGVRIATDPLTLEVLPIPATYPADQPWLPAESVSLSDDWSPTGTRFELGDPITRTLTARVVGNVSSAIPPLPADLPEQNLRHYPEPPDLQDDSMGMTLRGSRTQTAALMPTAAGTVTVPATELVWWDVSNHSVRTASVPARTLQLSEGSPQAGGAEQNLAADAAPENPEQALQPSTPAVDTDVLRDQVPWPGPERRRAMWLVALAVVILGVAMTLLWRWLRARLPWRPRQTRTRETEAPTGPKAARTRPPSERARWRTLRSRCRQGDPASIHEALTAYLQAYFSARDEASARGRNPGLHAAAAGTPAGAGTPFRPAARRHEVPLTEALRRFRAAGHADLLDQLNSARYRRDGGPVSDGGPASIDGRQVLAAVEDLRGTRRQRQPEPLPGLFD